MTQLANLLRGFLFVCLISYSASAQITNTDCIGATPICLNVYEENIVPGDEGIFPNEINTSISCTAEEIKNIWYTFTVDKTGKFGFIIKPNDALADYDWALYNLTNASCSDIFTNPNLLVSCNAAGSSDAECSGDTGATGATTYSIQGGGCSAPIPDRLNGRNTFNDLVDVIEGNTYVLTVSNWSQRTGGYTIDFSQSGDIGIIDNINPTVSDIIAEDNCTVSEIELQFSENIQCSTINVENISIDGFDNRIEAVNSEVCAQGGLSDNRYTVILNEPIIITGDYSLMIIPTSRNPVNDLCDNSTGTLAQSFMVENNAPPPSLINVVPDDPCQINSVTINFSEPMLCTGVTTNSFTVNGPNGFIGGQTRESNCESVTSFIYDFDEPILDNEEYQLFINQIPGFQLTNTCFKNIDGNLMTIFKKESQGGANIESIGWNDECAIDELQITFSEAIICNTIANENLNIEYQGDILEGTIVDSNCDTNNPMTLTEITFQLDETISINGDYTVRLNTNGVNEVQTICGVPSPSDSRIIMVDLMLDPPMITGIQFPDSCNIQTMTVNFSKDVDCATAQTAGMNFQYGSREIGLTPASSACGITRSIEFNLNSVINSDGGYNLDYVQTPGAFTDVCNMAVESTNLMGSLTFNDCDSCFVYIPNAFSPNGDSVNDGVGPLSNCDFESVSMNVFDRWGNLVYESRGESIDWDGLFNGETIEPGVYAYIIEIELREFRRSSTRTRKGTFTVM